MLNPNKTKWFPQETPVGKLFSLTLGVVALFAAMTALVAGCSPAANAKPGTEMMLGEFATEPTVMVQTGCVSPYPGKPNFVEFSTIYLGTEDAALQLEHVVNGRWVTSSFEEGLRITVDGDQHDPSQPFVVLRGGANQRFDMTVFNIQPNETWRLVGGHSYSPVTLLASWSAAERNECKVPSLA